MKKRRIAPCSAVVATITGFQLGMLEAKLAISFSIQLPGYLGVATVFIKSRLLAILLLKPKSIGRLGQKMYRNFSIAL